MKNRKPTYKVKAIDKSTVFVFFAVSLIFSSHFVYAVRPLNPENSMRLPPPIITPPTIITDSNSRGISFVPADTIKDKLLNAGIKTVGQLHNLTPKQLKAILGSKDAKLVQKELNRLNITSPLKRSIEDLFPKTEEQEIVAALSKAGIKNIKNLQESTPEQLQAILGKEKAQLILERLEQTTLPPISEISIEYLFPKTEQQKIVKALSKAGIKTLGDLKKLTQSELRTISGLREKGVQSIIDGLKQQGISLSSKPTLSKRIITGTTSAAQRTASGATSLAQTVVDGTASGATSVVKGATFAAQRTASGATSLAQTVVDGTASGATSVVKGATSLAQTVVDGTASGAASIVKGTTSVVKRTGGALIPKEKPTVDLREGIENFLATPKSEIAEVSTEIEQLFPNNKSIVEALSKAGIKTLEDLNNLTRKELLAIKGIGKRSVEIILGIIGTPSSLEEIFGRSIAKALFKAGVDTLADLDKLTPEEILDIQGIGEKSLKIIIERTRTTPPSTKLGTLGKAAQKCMQVVGSLLPKKK